jgi:histidinol phosphatase-like PHP family hydrolase
MKKDVFPLYKAKVSQLKEKYADPIEIFLGREVDYIHHFIFHVMFIK